MKFHGSVTGLGKGTIVRYNGLEAGRVDDLIIDPKDSKTVLATIKVDRTYDIHEDATAAIASQGLTGGSYVELLGGSMTNPILAACRTAATSTEIRRSRRYHRHSKSWNIKLDMLSDKLNMTADRVNLLLDDKNRKAIADILEPCRRGHRHGREPLGRHRCHVAQCGGCHPQHRDRHARSASDASAGRRHAAKSSTSFRAMPIES